MLCFSLNSTATRAAVYHPFKRGFYFPTSRPVHTHDSVCFFFSFLRILADSASVEFVLFLASLQFHKEIFETERLYVSSGVSWKKRKKKKTAGWHCLKSLWQLQTCVCNCEMEHGEEIKTHAGCYSHQINVTNTMKGTFRLTRKISADGTRLY